MRVIQYLIMFLIVLGLAFADFVTGYIKARYKGKVSSKALRRGGLHKLSELTVMAAAIGLTVGLDMLGQYYNDRQLTDLAGLFTALSVFVYIVIMEIVSILENFAAITPEAAWARNILKRMKNYETEVENNVEKTDT